MASHLCVSSCVRGMTRAAGNFFHRFRIQKASRHCEFFHGFAALKAPWMPDHMSDKNTAFHLCGRACVCDKIAGTKMFFHTGCKSREFLLQHYILTDARLEACMFLLSAIHCIEYYLQWLLYLLTGAVHKLRHHLWGEGRYAKRWHFDDRWQVTGG